MAFKASAQKWHYIIQDHILLAKVNHVARPDINGTGSIIILQRERALGKKTSVHSVILEVASLF